MSRNIFQIEQGRFGLAIVDTAEAGYEDTWQAPGGGTVDTVTLADYDTNSQGWTCQIVAGALEATPDTTTTDVPATWCEPAESTPTPGKTTYAFNGSFLQDPNLVNGLNRFLFEHDTEEAYLFAGFDGDVPPRLIGRVRLAAGTIGGEARTSLTADLSLPLSRKPDIEFGNATDSAVVVGGEGAPATGATAGIPGTWTPPGSEAPASVADLIAGTPNAVTASPATTWTAGQYVQTQTGGTGGRAHWNGTAWVAGAKP